jgi:hypothetical protein
VISEVLVPIFVFAVDKPVFKVLIDPVLLAILVFEVAKAVVRDVID